MPAKAAGQGITSYTDNVFPKIPGVPRAVASLVFVCVMMSVCLSVTTLRLGFFWKFNMFYKMGGINYFLYLKSRKTFSSMGLVPSKMAKMPKSRVFGAKRNVPDDVGGYTTTKKFYFWNSVSSLFGGPICQITNFGAPHGALQHYFAEKRSL